MLDKSNAMPLWEQLEIILRKKLEDNEWKVGEMIDSENELAKQYEISRMTVRSVITKLVQENLLYRVPGKGTFVAEPKIHAKSLAYMGIREQLEERGIELNTKVLRNEIIVPSKRIADKMDIGKNVAVYYVERMRYLKGKPLSLHKTYLKQLFNPMIDEERLGKEQLCHILDKDYGIYPTNTAETLEMVYADEESADKFGIEESSPLLFLQESRYFHEAMTDYSEIYFKGDKIRISFEYENEKRKT